jgi:hypothetical protein
MDIYENFCVMITNITHFIHPSPIDRFAIEILLGGKFSFYGSFAEVLN